MELLGELHAIWRYPVKSLAAQPLDSAQLTPAGIPGDRASALFVDSGHAREGKTYRGKENNRLHLTDDSHEAVSFAAQRGVKVTLRTDESARFFDDAPVSLIFSPWIDEVAAALDMTLDPRRWRPNLYARAAGGFAYREADLTGASIAVGDAVLRVKTPIERCVTTTYDIETGESDIDVLTYVAQKRGAMLGVYCEVELAGTVRAGDALRLRDR